MTAANLDSSRSRALGERLLALLLDPRRSAALSREERDRARLLSILLLIFTFGMIAAAILPTFGTLYRAFAGGVVVHNVLAYILNRLGFVAPATVTTVLMVFASAFMQMFSRAQFTLAYVNELFLILNAGILFAFLLLPLRLFAVLSAAMILIASQIWRITPLVQERQIRVEVITAVVVLLMTLIAGYGRARQRAQIAAQQAALAASERRYRDLLDATSEGVVIHRDGVIVDINPAFTRLSGYTPDELIGTHIRNLYAPEYRERIPDYQKTTEPYQTEGILRDGSRRWFEIQGHLSEYGGERVRVAAVRDITEQKAQAERRALLEREQTRLRLLRQFIDNLSHDLRTPLSVIRVNTYLIRKLVADPAPIEPKLAVIEEQVDHLQAVLTDLLDMSRLDREDDARYQMADLAPGAVILPVVETLRPCLEARRHALTLDLPADLPHIHGDKNELQRLLRHLLENAIDYTPDGGAIGVRAAVTRLNSDGPQPPRCHLAISVQDNGIGIEPDAQPHVFDAFYRADSARSIDTGGAGIGLTIARRIALAHGGTLTVESAVGRGSTFTLHLPLPDEDDAVRSVADQPVNREG